MKKPIVAGLILAVWPLAACSGGEGGQVSPSSSLAAKALDANRQAPAEPIHDAVAGGTVTVLSTNDSPTIDPTRSNDSWSTSVMSGLVTRSLTQYVYDPEQRSMVLVPDIATDLGTPNDDLTQWTFTIRDGIRFEDGTRVTADDVAYGIKRSFDRTAFPDGPTYSNDYFLDGDAYEGPYRSGTEYPGVVVDGDTLTMKMAKPFPDMPYWAAFPAIGPIPEHGSDPATYGRHPLATGPYKIAAFSPGKSLTLVRNDEWDPATDPGRHAYPDRYVFEFNQDGKRIDATILGDSSQAQTTLTPDNVIPGDYAKADQRERVTLGSAPCSFMFLPDYRKITDFRVRRAIGYAFPYEKYAEIFGNIPDVTFLPATSILPPGFPGREDYNPLVTGPGKTDPDKAKDLLNQAGYAAGEYHLEFAYVDDPLEVRIKNQLMKSLEAGGFHVTPFETPTLKQYWAVENDPHAPINVRRGGLCADWPSGHAWLPPLFGSDASGNSAYFAEPSIDDEIERIGQLPIGEQPAAWGELDKTIMTDYYPAVVTGYLGVAMLHGSRLGGLNTDDTTGRPTWKDLYVVR